MATSPKDESDLLWLSRENDHIHQKQTADSSFSNAGESEPLFGTGKLPLQGEVDNNNNSNDDDDDDREEAQSSHYGSVPVSSTSGSPTPSSSAKSKGSKAKTRKKKKKKKATPTPPPQSIFDDDDDSDEDDDNRGDNLSSVYSDYDDDDDDSHSALTMDGKPHLPNRNWCLEFFRLVSAVTVIASLGLLATQLLPVILVPLKSQGYFDLALKVYVTCFCFLFIMVECDAPLPAVRNSQLLQTYLSRGFLYSFLGLICLQEAYSERVKEMVATHADEFHVAWASLFMQISSWLITACGIFYMLMGLCCLKKLRDRIRKRDRAVWKKYRRDYAEWKRLNGV